MRINGFTQIKAFYSWTFSNQNKHIKPQHISLYLFLLNQNNRANWIEWFKCPYDLAMTGSCISSKKTYYKCLNDLQEWKLIKYEKGVNNWKAPIIKLEVLKDTSTVPQSEPQPTQADTPQLTTLPIHIYKLITDNQKLITTNLSKWILKEKEIDEIKTKGEKIINLYEKFVEEIKVGGFATRIESLYMRLKLKPTKLTPLLKDFKLHIIEENRLHKDTNDFFINFKNWLNVQDRNKLLDKYK